MAQSIGSLVVEFFANTGKFRTDVQAAAASASQAAGSIKGSFGSIGGSVNSAVGSMLNFRNVIGTVLGTGGLGLLIKNAVQAGDNIAEMAQRIGISTDALQELSHAASLSGASTEDLESALRFLNKALGEAQSGSKEAAANFAKIGVDPTKFRDAGEAIGAVSDGMLTLGNEAQRTVSRLELLGRGGNQMAILLNEGSAGIQKLRDEAEKLERAKLDQAQKLSDDFTRLANTIRTNLHRALIDLGPVLLDTMSLFAKFAKYVSDLSNIYKDAFASNETASLDELANRIVDVTEKIKALKAANKPGSPLIADPKELAILEAQLFSLRELLRTRQTLEAKPPPTVSMTVTGGGIDPNALKALEEFRQKLIKLSISDETEKRLYDLRIETEKLTEKAPGLAGSIKKISAAMADIIKENAATEELRKLAEEAKKMMEIGDAGTVAAIEANIAAYEEEEAAIRRIGEAQHAANQAMEEQGTAGLIASIEANIDAYESELLAIVKIGEEKHRAVQANERLIESLQQQIDAFGMTERAAAIWNDQLRLSADTLPAVRAEVEALSGKLFDLKKEQEASAKIEGDLKNAVLHTTLTVSDTFVDMALTGKANFKEMADSIVKDLARIATKLLVVLAIETAIKAIRGWVGSTGSEGLSGGIGTSDIGRGAKGGVVKHRPGGKLMIVGEAGQDEAIIPLDRMNALGGGGGSHVEVNVYAPPGAKVEQRERTGPDGRQIRDIIITMVTAAVGEGQFDPVMKATYGLRRTGVTR